MPHSGRQISLKPQGGQGVPAALWMVAFYLPPLPPRGPSSPNYTFPLILARGKTRNRHFASVWAI